MNDVTTGLDDRARLADCYAVMAELWCSSQDVDLDEARRKAAGMAEWLADVDPDAASSFAQFLRADPIAEDQYVELFELQPQCALYLGSHVFDEPKTCAGAGVSDRNAYMIELVGVYRHFGRTPDGHELPDYLPLMVEFLGLTAESGDDPVREKFVGQYLLPFLPPMRKRLAEISTPYLHLLDALERLVNGDLNASRRSHVG